MVYNKIYSHPVCDGYTKVKKTFTTIKPVWKRYTLWNEKGIFCEIKKCPFSVWFVCKRGRLGSICFCDLVTLLASGRPIFGSSDLRPHIHIHPFTFISTLFTFTFLFWPAASYSYSTPIHFYFNTFHFHFLILTCSLIFIFNTHSLLF